jgi:hypothetical protein
MVSSYPASAVIVVESEVIVVESADIEFTTGGALSV